jgi:uncharacterized membrane protein YcaP (DUF421 family)
MPSAGCGDTRTMDPLRVGVRCLIAYSFLLMLLRLSGKRTIQQGTSFDFVLALILGDLIDDAIWAEVPVAQFVIAATTLILTKLVATLHKQKIGAA